jgi:putative transcriptional regulator
LGKDHKKLLNNLEELRKIAGLTQQELSESADVSRKSINAIENGIYVPSTVLALKISKTLGCKVEDLFRLPNCGVTKNYHTLPKVTH